MVSVQIGQVQQYAAASSDASDKKASDRKAWTTAFFKKPVLTPVEVTFDGLKGDEQADLKNHGGPDKAVLFYCADHFAQWSIDLGGQLVEPGGFGENFSVSGVGEQQVCIGDQWKLGEAVVEITQPRQPCWKLGRRWEFPTLPKMVIQSGRTGWYARVVQEGTVAAGCLLQLISRPHPDWTISKANEVFYNKSDERREPLAALPELSLAWQESLSKS